MACQEILTKNLFCELVLSRNLDKNVFIAKKPSIKQGLPVEKKPILTIAIISALLFSAIVVTQFVRSGAANPSVFQGHVPPENSTKPPSINVTSPLNNTIFDTKDISLRFNASIPKSPKVSSIYFTYIYYETTWHQGNCTLYDYHTKYWSSISEFKYYDLMKGLPEGNHSMVIHAEALGWYDADVINSNGTTWVSNHPLGVFSFDIDSVSTVFFTIDRTSPKISILSIGNKTYGNLDVTLNFTVSESTSKISYTLDGQENVTIVGNTTLTGLSDGGHNITVYATDFAEHTSASETIYFSVEVPEPSPATRVIAPTASIALVSVGLLVYFKKHQRESGDKA